MTALRKEFGDLVAVDDVSFRGRRTAGRWRSWASPGSGKTTIARMIVGLERADRRADQPPAAATGPGPARSARATGGGAAARCRSCSRTRTPAWTRGRPPRRAIDEVLRLHHGWTADRRRERVAELTGLVGLDDRQARALPRALSGGQRQRVAIARALAAEPRMLILDESVAALDVSIQAQVLNLLADIRDATGITYLLISHDLAVVRQLTDQVIVLRRGQRRRARPDGQRARRPAAPLHPAAAGERPAAGLETAPRRPPASPPRGEPP